MLLHGRYLGIDVDDALDSRADRYLAGRQRERPVGGGFIKSLTGQIAEFAIERRLPTSNEARDFVDAGGLVSYAPSAADLCRRAATYVDKILKGAKPAELPVEQPIRFELVFNLKTANAIGVTVPPTLLQLADALIR